MEQESAPKNNHAKEEDALVEKPLVIKNTESESVAATQEPIISRELETERLKQIREELQVNSAPETKTEGLSHYTAVMDKLWIMFTSNEPFGADYNNHFSEGTAYLTKNCSVIFDLLWEHVSRSGDSVSEESKWYLWKLQQLRTLTSKQVFNTCLQEHLTNEEAFEHLLETALMPATTDDVIESTFTRSERFKRIFSTLAIVIAKGIKRIFYKT